MVNPARHTRGFYRNSMVYSPTQNYRENEPESEEFESEINNTDNMKNNTVHNKPQNKMPIISGIFDGGIDSEKLTIIALIIILAKEGADIKLVLALGYILI